MYEDRLVLLQAAEAAGFYGYHLTEHHATPLSMTPSPTVYLAAAARETTRIRLGTLLFLLPLYHPLRLYEELCMLDHLSGGRLDIGVGRGIAPPEFAAYGSDFERSSEDFQHAFNVIYQGFTQDRIDYKGPRYEFKDVPVVLKPRQRPHPPFWYGLRGDHGPIFAAQRGMHGVTLGPDERVADMLATFRRHWESHADERKRFNSPVTLAVRRRDARDVRRRQRRRGRAHRAPGLHALVRQSRLAVEGARHLPADRDLGRLRPVEGGRHAGGRQPRHASAASSPRRRRAAATIISSCCSRSAR